MPGDDAAAKIAELRTAITVAGLADEYLKKEVTPMRKPETALLYTHYISAFIKPEICKLEFERLTRTTAVLKVHLNISETRSVSVSANRGVDTISGIFTFGEKNDLLPVGLINPARGVEKFKEQGRERLSHWPRTRAARRRDPRGGDERHSLGPRRGEVGNASPEDQADYRHSRVRRGCDPTADFTGFGLREILSRRDRHPAPAAPTPT